MEATAVILVAFLLLLGGAAALWTRQGGTFPRSWAPRLHAGRGDSPRAHVAEVASALPVTTASTTNAATSLVAQTSPASTAVPQGDVALRMPSERNRPLPAVSTSDSLDFRLDRIEQAISNLERADSHRAVEQTSDLRKVVAEFTALVDADLARRDAAIERLRADLVAAIATQKTSAPAAVSGRPRACVELYAKLAGVETALGAVTNPMLLPGETYFPPEELLPEALVWDNWNEVGERAFLFAETYSSERLHLSAETRLEVSAFVTQLRSLLTGSIYPNTRTDPSTIQMATLRKGLDDIAVALPLVREALEREFRQG